jgi:hypothetical protein
MSLNHIENIHYLNFGRYRPRCEALGFKSVLISFGPSAGGEADLKPYTKNICRLATNPATLKFYADCYNQEKQVPKLLG